MAETAEKTKTPTWDAIDLKPFLRQEIGDESAPVTGVRQLVGGASRDLWYFKVETGATGGDAPTGKVEIRTLFAIGGGKRWNHASQAALRSEYDRSEVQRAFHTQERTR